VGFVKKLVGTKYLKIVGWVRAFSCPPFNLTFKLKVGNKKTLVGTKYLKIFALIKVHVTL